MSKHYVRIDSKNNIIKGFSTDFENSIEGDICVNEDGGRHFQLLNIINPSMVNKQMIYLYKYVDYVIQLKTDEEIALEVSELPALPKTEQEIADERLVSLENAMNMLISMSMM